MSDYLNHIEGRGVGGGKCMCSDHNDTALVNIYTYLCLIMLNTNTIKFKIKKVVFYPNMIKLKVWGKKVTHSF